MPNTRRLGPRVPLVEEGVEAHDLMERRDEEATSFRVWAGG